MDPDPPLDYLLDPPSRSGPPPGRAELVGIVGRSRRWQFRTAAIGMALALVLGVAGGWLVEARRSSHASTVVAGGLHLPATPSEAPTTPAGAAALSPIPQPVTLTKIFIRTTSDGVTIRGYRSASFNPAGSCGATQASGVVVELSTTAVAAPAAPFLRTDGGPIAADSLERLGVAEQAPFFVLQVATRADVAKVLVKFDDGVTDEMAPVDGFSVLAHLDSARNSLGPTAKLVAFDAHGKVLATRDVEDDTTFTPLGPLTTTPGTVVSPPPVASPPAAAGGTTTPPIAPIPTTTVPSCRGSGSGPITGGSPGPFTGTIPGSGAASGSSSGSSASSGSSGPAEIAPAGPASVPAAG